MVIPQIIHQVWYTIPGKSGKMPVVWQESVNEWQRLHPGWQYILWNNEMGRKFIEEKEPHFLPYYLAFKYEIQRIDAIRYVFLKHIGGIYCDLDVVPLADISQHIKSNAPAQFIFDEKFPNICRNDFMVSDKTSDIWDICINLMKNPKPFWAHTKTFKVISTTGPLMLAKAINMTDNDVGRLPHRFNHMGSHPKKILKALEGRSWNGWDSKIYRYAIKFWIFTLIILIIILVIIIAIIIKLYKMGKLLGQNKKL